MEVEKGIQRWVVDITKWNPSPNSFSYAMSFLPFHQHSSITRYVKLEDRKRAYVSRLLQYSLVHQLFGIPFDKIVIRRTDEGKPFLVCDNVQVGFPNFNFNVSHHAEEFVKNFSYFSRFEWNHVTSARTADEMLIIFYRYWCLKEAYVKAIGTGVGHKLDDVEFHHSSWDNIFVKVAGEELKDWKFWLYKLGQNHSISIARGPPRAATASYRRTLNQTNFGENEYNIALHVPNPSFTFQTVDDLVKLCHGGDRTLIVLSIHDHPDPCDDDES